MGTCRILCDFVVLVKIISLLVLYNNLMMLLLIGRVDSGKQDIILLIATIPCEIYFNPLNILTLDFGKVHKILTVVTKAL